MTPHNQSPWGDCSLLPVLIIAAFSTTWEKVTHKSLLAIALTVIGALSFWGFSSTLNRLAAVEKNQVEGITLVAKNQTDLMKIITDDILVKAHRDSNQDLCIERIQERQNNVIKTLDELKALHNGKKVPRLGGGEFGER